MWSEGMELSLSDQSARITAIRAHHAYLQTHVLGPAAANRMSNQVLRGGRLWIDGCIGAKPSTLGARKITAILALGDDDECYLTPPSFMSYHLIVLEDDPSACIKDHFDVATQWIHDELQKPDGRVLVHCAAGVSRSATLCIAYLMRFLHLPLDAAYAVVLSARPIIDPNAGFLAQLMLYEGELAFNLK